MVKVRQLPIPTASEREAIVIFLCEKPHLEIIWIPEVRIVPNIMIVHPPNTDSGREATKFPMGGSSPARIIHTAPVMIVTRFTTFVIVISPTFCEKEVTGGQPKMLETDDAYPSQANEPDISFPSISLLRPLDTNAVVSPIVSAADTRKMMHVDTIALT